MRNEECQNCRFYFPPLCRRFPPQVVYNTEDVEVYIELFPTVDPKDYCGEWKEGVDA